MYRWLVLKSFKNDEIFNIKVVRINYTKIY